MQCGRAAVHYSACWTLTFGSVAGSRPDAQKAGGVQEYLS